MKKIWQPLIMKIVSIDTHAQDILTLSPNSEVGIDFEKQWSGLFKGGEIYD